ncbi:hypothetical protein ACDY96_23870 [Rhizobium mongolense]
MNRIKVNSEIENLKGIRGRKKPLVNKVSDKPFSEPQAADFTS